MRAFISDFRTTNELLFKERNNSLSELKFEGHELLRVIDNAPIPNYEVNGVTTRGGKMTTQDIQSNNTNIHAKEPLVLNRDKLVDPKEVLVKNQKTNEPVVQPSIKVQTPSIPFPRRLRKEKEEAQQKRTPAEDDKCYGIDDLDDTINMETQELLANDESDSFLLKGLEKSINQSDLESCESLGIRLDDVYDIEETISAEHLYSASANEIDEKRHELKSLPHHLEYAYLHGDKSFPIIISSKLFEKEKMLLLQVLEKRKGAIAWKMSDIKGKPRNSDTQQDLNEDDFKLAISAPKTFKILKCQDVEKNEDLFKYLILG
ncbi:hypothetical protein Tco_0304026 [Tanacetum coccineum]